MHQLIGESQLDKQFRSFKKPQKGFLARLSSLCATLLVATLGVSNLAAAAECKGQVQASCESTESCSWVNSYERKDGRTVKGFCRTKTKFSSKAGKSAKDAKKPS